MKDLIVSQITGYLAMTITIVAIGLSGQFVLESATGQKMVFAQSFLIFFIGVCLGLIARSQTVLFYMKSIAQEKKEPRTAKAQKLEQLFRSYWFNFSMAIVCGVIAGVVIPLLDRTFGS